MKKIFVYCFLLTGGLSSCYRASTELEPHLAMPSHPKEIQREKRLPMTVPANFSHNPFFPLTEEESQQEWGKELKIGLAFAEEFDLYRAITSLKRALFLLPQEKVGRRLEIEYDIALAYYLGKKYVDAAYIIENGGLASIDSTFPAYQDFLLVLYDCYKQLGQEETAGKVLALIEGQSKGAAAKLSCLSMIEKGKLLAFCEENATYPPYFEGICENYQKGAKSVRKAEVLNAIFPGVGYWYVGQRNTAITSFLVNSLFIGAAAYFFDQGNIPAGAITLSLESGWYFGGIYGAGLAAKAYNEQLYAGYGEKIAQREQLYPLMMLKFTF